MGGVSLGHIWTVTCHVPHVSEVDCFSLGISHVQVQHNSLHAVFVTAIPCQCFRRLILGGDLLLLSTGNHDGRKYRDGQ